MHSPESTGQSGSSESETVSVLTESGPSSGQNLRRKAGNPPRRRWIHPARETQCCKSHESERTHGKPPSVLEPVPRIGRCVNPSRRLHLRFGRRLKTEEDNSHEKEDRERVQIEVVSRVTEGVFSSSKDMPLENLLNDTLYRERKRLEREPASAQRTYDLQFWNDVGKNWPVRRKRAAKALATNDGRYTAEVMGQFNELFYEWTTALAPAGLAAILNGLSPRRSSAGRADFISRTRSSWTAK